MDLQVLVGRGGGGLVVDLDLETTLASSASRLWQDPGDVLYSTAIVSSAGPPSMMINLRGIQKFGENIFAAMLIVAVMQAIVALFQYRTNPTGQLIAPPGLTYGVAVPAPRPTNRSKKSVKEQSQQQQQKSSTVSSKQRRKEEDPEGSTVSAALDKPTISTATSQYARIINRINRWLVVLIPWASRRFGSVLARNTHMFHLGFIITLAGLFDIPNRWFSFSSSNGQQGRHHVVATNVKKTVSQPRPLERLIVIGDSLAVGMGSAELFDAEKDNSVPFCRIENIKDDLGDGPIFPRVLAESLANYSGRSVHWRSAGVDGGDTQLIQEYCLGLIQEEVDQGRPPDVVVILCGINDLKYYVSNPFQAAGPRTFRARLKTLIQKIKQLSPNTKVVLPMVPTQMFHRNSPLNIFPLSFFLDGIVGFWDSQKKLVADRFPSQDVLYLGLSPGEIFDWYHNKDLTVDKDEDEDLVLIAADGVHPNANCYALWANSLGNKLVRAINSSRGSS
jgi:lysophospholipase L1-like esterase